MSFPRAKLNILYDKCSDARVFCTLASGNWLDSLKGRCTTVSHEYILLRTQSAYARCHIPHSYVFKFNDRSYIGRISARLSGTAVRISNSGLADGVLVAG